MPSAPRLKTFSYCSTSATSSSASSLSSESLYSNTTTFINNCLIRDKKTSVINSNDNYNKQTIHKHIEQQSPSKHIFNKKEQHVLIYGKTISQPLEKTKIVKTETTTIKRNLMQTPLSQSKPQQQRQMQYTQQVKCHQDKESIINKDLPNHLRKRKIFADQKADDSRKVEATLNASHLQYKEDHKLIDEKPRLPQESASAIHFDDSTYTKTDLGIKLLTQVRKEPTDQTNAATNNIIITNKVKCQIFNNSLTATSSSAIPIQTPTKTDKNINKKRHFLISNDKKTSFKQQQIQLPNTHKQDSHESQVNIDCKSPNGPPETVVSCGEDFAPIEASENLKRHKSLRRSSTRKSSAGSGGATYSSPNHSKCNKQQSPTQNSEVDLTGDPSKKRFSYCSSCSSSNSCNCDITGENSNTLYEGFGIGIVVSSSYTDDCVTGSGGIVSLPSATNGGQAPVSSSSSLAGNTNDNFCDLQLNGVEYPEKFDECKDNDQTANASDNCSEFDETCSEQPSLIEDLPRAETENKILSNNLKNYSKFHEKLNKQIQKQRVAQLSTLQLTPSDSDLEAQSYKIQNLFYSDKTLHYKDYLQHNIFISYSNNSLNFNNMNFDAANNNNAQTDVPTRTRLGTNSGGVGVQSGVGSGGNGDQNELNNLYATGGGIPNIPETMNGTTLCGATPGAGANQQKSTGGTTQKRPQRRGGKQQPDRPESALFCLTLKNPVRAFCIRIVDSKHPFSKTITETKLLRQLYKELCNVVVVYVKNYCKQKSKGRAANDELNKFFILKTLTHTRLPSELFLIIFKLKLFKSLVKETNHIFNKEHKMWTLYKHKQDFNSLDKQFSSKTNCPLA